MTTTRAAAILLTACALTLGVADPAAAYVGPGAGMSLMGAVWGLLLAILAALGFVILWPLRRLLRRGRATPAAAETAATASVAPASAEGAPGKARNA